MITAKYEPSFKAYCLVINNSVQLEALNKIFTEVVDYSETTLYDLKAYLLCTY